MVLLLGWLLLTGGVAILAGSLGYLGVRRRDAGHRRRVQTLLSQPFPPIFLPGRPAGDATYLARGPVNVFFTEGGPLIARLAAGETACFRYRSREGQWHEATPPGVDATTGERLATESERAGFRDGRECRTWGLYARVR